MKYLILFLISFNLFAVTKIEIFDGDKLVAGDSGKNVTIHSLRAKMLKRGVDINNSKYRKIVKDIKIVTRKEKLLNLKLDLESIPAGPVKRVLTELMRGL